MFRELESKKLVEMDSFSSAPIFFDEVKMDVPKGYCAKDTYGTLSSANHPISVAAPKLPSFNMDSRYVFLTKHSPLHH